MFIGQGHRIAALLCAGFLVTVVPAGSSLTSRPGITIPPGRTAPASATKVIVIDPGHPSERNDGRRMVNGISEVRACWLVAEVLRKELGSAGYRVVMTKSRENQFVRNRERARIANRNGASLLLRLHCDAGLARGFAIYYPDRSGSAEGRRGPTARVMARSREAARRFHPAFAAILKGRLRDNGIRGDSKTYVGRRQGALTGSIFSQVPVLTVEMCVLDNRSDAAFIRNRKGQELMATALAAGVSAAVGRPAARKERSTRAR